MVFKFIPRIMFVSVIGLILGCGGAKTASSDTSSSSFKNNNTPTLSGFSSEVQKDQDLEDSQQSSSSNQDSSIDRYSEAESTQG